MLDCKVERDTLAADYLAADTEIDRLIDVSFVIIFYYRSQLMRVAPLVV